MRRGAKISSLSYLAANIYHTSANLTFGGGENIWWYKKLQRAPKPYKGRYKPEK